MHEVTLSNSHAGKTLPRKAIVVCQETLTHMYVFSMMVREHMRRLNVYAHSVVKTSYIVSAMKAGSEPDTKHVTIQHMQDSTEQDVKACVKISCRPHSWHRTKQEPCGASIGLSG